MTFNVGERAEALVVLWTGGWADLEASIGGQLVFEGPQVADVQSCVAVADGLGERLFGSAT